MINVDMLPRILGKYKQNPNIGKMCWFKTHNIADILYIPKDIEDLQQFLIEKPNDIHIHIIGAGSNTLVVDERINGVVIRLGLGFHYITHHSTTITVGCSYMDYNLAKYAANNSISGLEFFSGIPGNIGGALAMNAGSYDNDTSKVLVEAKAINILTGEKKNIQKQQIGYYYRGKTVGNEWLFYEAKFQGSKGNKKDILLTIDNMRRKRLSIQPTQMQTGGSTFKNPPHKQAWKIIESCGLRGKKIGKAKFSETHCNFLINEGDAKVSDLINLIKLAKQGAKKKFNIVLEQEIRLLSNDNSHFLKPYLSK